MLIPALIITVSLCLAWLLMSDGLQAASKQLGCQTSSIRQCYPMRAEYDGLLATFQMPLQRNRYLIYIYMYYTNTLESTILMYLIPTFQAQCSPTMHILKASAEQPGWRAKSQRLGTTKGAWPLSGRLTWRRNFYVPGMVSWRNGHDVYSWTITVRIGKHDVWWSGNCCFTLLPSCQTFQEMAWLLTLGKKRPHVNM